MNMPTLADNMKKYENIETNRVAIPKLPIMVRLDGKNFSKFTKKFKNESPYNELFGNIMISVTKFLVHELNAVIGYTQSDEISLILFDDQNEMYFGGRFQKLTSVIASMCTAKFNQLSAKNRLSSDLAYFDCRVWNVPSKLEACNSILWREYDCIRNSVSILSSCHYTDKQLKGKDTDERLLMLASKDINYKSYPYHFKYGTFVKRVECDVVLDGEQLEKIPEKYRPVNNLVKRNVTKEITMTLNCDDPVSIVFGD